MKLPAKTTFLLVATLLTAPLTAFAEKDMTLDDAHDFLKNEDYTSCHSDNECILTTDKCDVTVSINKNKQTDYDLASKIMSRRADCSGKPRNLPYYSACQENKCAAVIRPDNTKKP